MTKILPLQKNKKTNAKHGSEPLFQITEFMTLYIIISTLKIFSITSSQATVKKITFSSPSVPECSLLSLVLPWAT